ncbi:MAG: hypothetical protein ACRCWQ_02685 [Bacilli bacterium]
MQPNINIILDKTVTHTVHELPDGSVFRFPARPEKNFIKIEGRIIRLSDGSSMVIDPDGKVEVADKYEWYVVPTSMRIVDGCTYHQTKPFYGLRCGDVFIHENTIYMKITKFVDPKDGQLNAIDLTANKFDCIRNTGDTQVVIVDDVQLNITYSF